MEKLRGIYKTISRRKVNITQDSPLARVLSTVDLIALGVGSTLQYNAYLLMGISLFGARLSIIISIIIAAIISMFTGLCYAEFSARIPRAGSAYIYSYVTMGEFVAFFTGWIMILKYMIDSAITVDVLYKFVDTLYLNNSMKNFYESVVPINIESLMSEPFPDIFEFSVTLIFSGVLALGIKKSCVLNNTLILLKLSTTVTSIVIIFNSCKGDIETPKINNFSILFFNYSFEKDFYDIWRIIDGTIILSTAFIDFDCVTTMGEEAKNPQQSIPRAIIASLTITFFIYFGVFVTFVTFIFLFYKIPNVRTLTLSELINIWVKWFLTVEIISGFCTSLLSSMLSLPRVIYAMASDGLIFKSLSYVNPRFQTPIIGTLIAGLGIDIPAIIFDTESLKNMKFVCTSVIYSIVALCIIIFRYEENESYRRQDESSDNPQTFTFIMKQLVNGNKLKHPTKLTAQIVNVLLCCYVILCIYTVSLLSVSDFEKGKATNVIQLIILIIALVIILCFIYFQPVSDKKLTFSVPLVPFLPGFSIFLNFYIIKIFYSLIWIDFFLWMAIGLGVYFLYGIWHSNIRQREPS